ncbi:MAG TPA: hypothetical protein VF430_03120, partial [Verrucomicrobiae bacterium]
MEQKVQLQTDLLVSISLHQGLGRQPIVAIDSQETILGKVNRSNIADTYRQTTKTLDVRSYVYAASAEHIVTINHKLHHSPSSSPPRPGRGFKVRCRCFVLAFWPFAFNLQTSTFPALTPRAQAAGVARMILRVGRHRWAGLAGVSTAATHFHASVVRSKPKLV